MPKRELVLGLAVDDPVGVEDLVPAVLRVRLGEHHQLHIRGVAPQGREALGEVVDLVRGQGQTQGPVGLRQGGPAAGQHIHPGQGTRLGVLEQAPGLRQVQQGDLGHAVVQGRGGLGHGIPVQPCVGLQVIGGAALQAPDAGEPAVVGNVGRLGRPGGDGPRARHHQDQTPLGCMGRETGPIAQQPLQHPVLVPCQVLPQLGEVHELRVEPQIQAGGRPQTVLELLQAEVREGGGAAQCQHGGIPGGVENDVHDTRCAFGPIPGRIDRACGDRPRCRQRRHMGPPTVRTLAASLTSTPNPGASESVRLTPAESPWHPGWLCRLRRDWHPAATPQGQSDPSLPTRAGRPWRRPRRGGGRRSPGPYPRPRPRTSPPASGAAVGAPAPCRPPPDPEPRARSPPGRWLRSRPPRLWWPGPRDRTGARWGGGRRAWTRAIRSASGASARKKELEPASCRQSPARGRSQSPRCDPQGQDLIEDLGAGGGEPETALVARGLARSPRRRGPGRGGDCPRRGRSAVRRSSWGHPGAPTASRRWASASRSPSKPRSRMRKRLPAR